MAILSPYNDLAAIMLLEKYMKLLFLINSAFLT